MDNLKDFSKNIVKFADYSIISADGDHLRVNKIILYSRCDMFKKMFDLKMADSREKLKSSYKKPALNAFLNILYSDFMEVPDEGDILVNYWADVLSLASLFQSQKILDSCQTFILANSNIFFTCAKSFNEIFMYDLPQIHRVLTNSRDLSGLARNIDDISQLLPSSLLVFKDAVNFGEIVLEWVEKNRANISALNEVITEKTISDLRTTQDEYLVKLADICNDKDTKLIIMNKIIQNYMIFRRNTVEQKDKCLCEI